MADAEALLERFVSVRDSLEHKVAALLTSEVFIGKDRLLRLNADQRICLTKFLQVFLF